MRAASLAATAMLAQDGVERRRLHAVALGNQPRLSRRLGRIVDLQHVELSLRLGRRKQEHDLALDDRVALFHQ
jgi:hypothetical protein